MPFRTLSDERQWKAPEFLSFIRKFVHVNMYICERTGIAFGSLPYGWERVYIVDEDDGWERVSNVESLKSVFTLNAGSFFMPKIMKHG